MAQKDIGEFARANEYVMNKDTVVKHYIKYMLSRTQSMFTYSGLPDTIPASKLEYILQTQGYAFVTRVDNDLYALKGSLGGELDAYDDPTQIVVANTYLKLSKQYDLEKEGVLINNDTLRLGLLPILNKYAALLAENTITIHTVDIVLRMVCMISASDDRTYAGAEKFIRDIEAGKISAIGESAFFDGVKTHSTANTQNYLTQFIELEQYLKASCFNEIGLNANYNMKREALSSNESALNDDFLLPLVDNMIKERVTAIEKINTMFGTEISIDYASAWKATHEENEKQIAISESLQETIPQGEADISINQKQGAHDLNQPVIKLEGGESSEDTGNREGSSTEQDESEDVPQGADNEPEQETPLDEDGNDSRSNSDDDEGDAEQSDSTSDKIDAAEDENSGNQSAEQLSGEVEESDEKEDEKDE